MSDGVLTHNQMHTTESRGSSNNTQYLLLAQWNGMYWRWTHKVTVSFRTTQLKLFSEINFPTNTECSDNNSCCHSNRCCENSWHARRYPGSNSTMRCFCNTQRAEVITTSIAVWSAVKFLVTATFNKAGDFTDNGMGDGRQDFYAVNF